MGTGRRGEREIIYVSLHCHHQNDSCIKMGSDQSHFNVSSGSDGQSHRTVSTNHNLFEETGKPKKYQTEVLPLTSLTPYRQAKRAQVGFIAKPISGLGADEQAQTGLHSSVLSARAFAGWRP